MPAVLMRCSGASWSHALTSASTPEAPHATSPAIGSRCWRSRARASSYHHARGFPRDGVPAAG
eukprot:1589750-Pleurochrysis_carterae.AAC.1